MDTDRALSQDEIDALLAAIPSGSAAARDGADKDDGVRRYDFRAPDRFSKEQVRTLQMIYSAFGRHFSGSLSAALRTTVQVAFVHIEQSTFGDFSETLPESAITTVVSMEPLPGRCLVQFDMNVLLAAIDRLLGGHGKAIKVDDDRELTDIEQKLIASLLHHFENAMREAWAALLDVRPLVADISTRNQVLQIALPTDAAVMVVFEIRMQDMAGVMSVCLPYELLKPVATKLTPQAWITAGGSGNGGQVRELVEFQVERVPVTVTALLGTAELAVRDLTDLRIGDVLVLDSVVTDEVAITVESETKYLGWPGLLRNHRAVKIASVLEDDGWL
ncbi:MAG: flagellar motor switch protein FliM [Anaerolineae bacterium]